MSPARMASSANPVAGGLISDERFGIAKPWCGLPSQPTLTAAPAPRNPSSLLPGRPVFLDHLPGPPQGQSSGRDIAGQGGAGGHGDALVEALIPWLAADDTLLLKASRGVALEKALPLLESALQPN